MANCPKCKIELAPARTDENKPAIDGLKCTKCDKMYVLDRTSHLVPFEPGMTRPEFMNILKTVTRPIKEPAKTEPRVADAPSTAQSSSLEVVQTTPTFVNDYHEVTEKDAATILERLAKGDAPSVIAREMKFKTHQIYYVKGKSGIKNTPTSSLSDADKAEIYRRRQAGESTASLMKAFKCKPWAIYYYGDNAPKVTTVLSRWRSGTCLSLKAIPKCSSPNGCRTCEFFRLSAARASSSPDWKSGSQARLSLKRAENGFLIEVETNNIGKPNPMYVFRDFASMSNWLECYFIERPVKP